MWAAGTNRRLAAAGAASLAGLTSRYLPDDSRGARGHLGCHRISHIARSAVPHATITRCEGSPMAKKYGPEWNFELLSGNLMALCPEQRRVALSLLGLALGDAAGLPFELGHGIQARKKFHGLTSDDMRYELAKTLVAEGVGPNVLDRKKLSSTRYLRTFSDDTTCCDLKMEAVCQAAGKLERKADGDSAESVLQLSVLQQYLKWAHGTKKAEGAGACGELFQGTGAFTQDFLVPYFRKRHNEVARLLGNKPLYEDDPVQGAYWPSQDFAAFAPAYFQGEFSFPSWGNGAVMSFAPHPILAGRWRRCEARVPERGEAVHNGELKAAAAVLSRSHQEPTARLAAQLLWEILDGVYAGVVGSPEDLRRYVQHLQTVVELSTLEHECTPVAAFSEWLERGDCDVATAEAFLQRLTKSSEKFNLTCGRYGVFGAMLHIAADWDNDHNVRLARVKFPREPVMFSQRGLNSVIIAVWASAGGRSPWQVMDRVIYVGGDTDTVGAVAGQIACPLLDPLEVVDAFVDIVALGACPETASFRVANAAAKRFFKRALLFASGDWKSLQETPSLLDADYPYCH